MDDDECYYEEESSAEEDEPYDEDEMIKAYYQRIERVLTPRRPKPRRRPIYKEKKS